MLSRAFILSLLVLIGLTTAARSESGEAEAPFAIFEDEIYRRDGAIPSVKTCLAVANDPDAAALLQRVRDRKPVAEHRLANALQQSPTGIKETPGFGTLLACARIAEAWYAATISESGAYLGEPTAHGDGRREHGTIVVDLAITGFQNAQIAPVPLVRILTSRRLLPDAVFGGIVLKNAIVSDVLVFHNAHLAIPLAFARVRFLGGDYKKSVFGSDEPVTDTALTIIHSRFNDHVQIVDSELCGHVRIVDSVLRETLAFEQVVQSPMNACRYDRPQKTPFARIDGNSFEQGISIIQSDFRRVEMDGNDIDSLISSRSDFGAEFKVWNNDIGFLQLDCSSLAGWFDLSYNHIEKDAFIYGSRHLGEHYPEPDGILCEDWWARERDATRGRSTRIRISSNQIGGGLGVQGLDGSKLISPVDLKSNRVGNGSEIALPATSETGEFWQGQFELQGSSYQGTMALGQDRVPTDIDLEAGTYCENRSDSIYAVFDLTAVDIRVLEWELPLDCRYRWSGYGLTYDLWLAKHERKRAEKTKEDIDDQDVLADWRKLLEEPEAAPLNAMSRYLTDNGSSVDGRDILLEAKRLNYAPSCPPDQSTLRCIAEMLGLSWGQAQAATGSGDRGSDETGIVETIQDAFTLFMLWPGGFGAAPENALLWLIGTTVACWIAYALYSGYLQLILNGVPGLHSKLKKIRGSLIIPSSNADLTPEGRGQPSIEQAIAAIDGLCQRWPGESAWPLLKRDERLEIVQRTLIPGLLDCEASLLGSALADVRGIRLKLERFGNTEKLGFSLFDQGKMPVRFTYGRYAVDTMLPFIDLHAYNNYYPEWWPIRVLSVTQHVCGWWWLTVFIASAAIL